MKLLALFLLISAFSSPTQMEIVDGFRRCSEFFIKSPKQKQLITPTVFDGDQYKNICQRWNNAYTFATLYDTHKRIPVYSAYTFKGVNPPPRENVPWKNEPQLENKMDTKDMKKLSDAEMDVYYQQAVTRDYADSKQNTNPKIQYTRGHVFPRQYATHKVQAESTFTFTNVAPQTTNSNNAWEAQVETPMKDEINNLCNPGYSNPTYIVTGVVPGKRWISIKRKGNNNKYQTIDEGVNIPSYYWTAFCCHNNTAQVSRAYLSLQNQPNDAAYEAEEMTVESLNTRLSSLYEKDFRVFNKVKFCS